jgi:hypothetical protein
MVVGFVVHHLYDVSDAGGDDALGTLADPHAAVDRDAGGASLLFDGFVEFVEKVVMGCG